MKKADKGTSVSSAKTFFFGKQTSGLFFVEDSAYFGLLLFVSCGSGGECLPCMWSVNQWGEGWEEPEIAFPPVFNPSDFLQLINLKSLIKSILFAFTCLMELTVNGSVWCCPIDTFKLVKLRNKEKFMSVPITRLREISSLPRSSPLWPWSLSSQSKQHNSIRTSIFLSPIARF